MDVIDARTGKWIAARLVLIALALAVVTGLGAVSSFGSQTATGLTGKVLRGPISPVCRTDSPCYVPFKGTLVFTRVVSISGAPAAKRAQTSTSGTYRVLLAPGRYLVRSSRTVPSKFGSGVAPEVAVVPKTGIRRLNFLIDTGIR